MSGFNEAKAWIDLRLTQKQPMILALEGGAACGKTTLAAQLAHHYGALVIHMDEFFLPPAMRSEARFAEPGGNIHYERFNAQVAQPLRRGEAFSYEIFDCSAGKISGEKRIEKNALIIVEGVYSLHPLYRDIYTHSIFLKTDEKTQDKRLQARGEWLYQKFQSLWLPLERAYFQQFNIEKSCDLVLET